MNITVVPASTKAGQASIEALLADPAGPTVTGVYRNLAKVPLRFSSNPKFKAVLGDVHDGESLDFACSDAVIAITPPQYVECDIVADTRLMAENMKAAAQKAGIKRLVLLSSEGAQFEKGTGMIRTNHAAEQAFKDTAPEVVYVRCAYFMENWMMALDTAHLDPPFFYTTITPLDFKVPMIAVKDIGSTLAAQALATGSALPTNPHIFELWGPEPYSSLDTQAAFSAAAGRQVEVRPIPKEALLDFFGQAAFGPIIAKEYAEMSAAFLPGGIMETDLSRTESVVRGKTTLQEVIGELYNMPPPPP